MAQRGKGCRIFPCGLGGVQPILAGAKGNVPAAGFALCRPEVLIDRQA
jgi:hypothetical protein